ncbi:MAG TPA: globin domain-containing protein [Flavisolibacter sp.]|jgi:hemoglobin-like flavoprotein|nr:globin domain-containing protein [Flavisolibacter sp.]
MTKDQIALVRRTWRILEKVDPLLLGDVFYEKLFNDQPVLRKMFRTPRAEQSRKLIDMLSTIVSHLDSFELFIEEIRALGMRHVHYGVRPSHYESVGVALLWTLKQGLGSDWNTDVKEAWTTCYDLLSATMIQATQPA